MSTETNHTDFDRELLSAYVDGELTAVERAAVEARLASDPAAQRHVEEFRRLSGMIQSLPRPALPADFSAKVLQRAKEAQPAADVETLRPGLSIGRTWRSWLWAGAALAAALLIAVMLPGPQRELVRQDVATSAPAPASGTVPEMRAQPNGDRPLPARSEESLLADAAKPSEGQRSDGTGRMSIADDFDKNSDSLNSNELSYGAVPAENAPAENARFVIVRVSMPADALERRELEQLLAKQDIEVEAGEALDESGDSESRDGEATTRLRLMQEDAPAIAGTAGEIDRAAVVDKLGVELARTEPVEFLLVEAPPEQIAATLSAMKADVTNYHVVDVEPDSPTELRQYSRGLSLGRGGGGGERGANVLAEEKSAEGESVAEQPSDLARSTREEKAMPEELAPAPPEAAAPPTAALEVSPPPAAAPTPAPVTDAAPKGAVDPGAYGFQKKLLERGKAYRYLARDAKKLGTERFARQQTDEKELSSQFFAGGLKEGGKTPLQVLFVLETTPPQLAAPATDESPLPAGPAEPPK